MLTPHCSAASGIVAPSPIASTTRLRKSSEYGFAIHAGLVPVGSLNHIRAGMGIPRFSLFGKRSRRIYLAHLDIGERHRHGIDLGSMAWLGDAHASGLHVNLGDASSFTGSSWRNANIHCAEFAPVGWRIKQALGVGELAILCGAHDQIHTRRKADKLRIDVEFPIADNDQ